jgi:2-C-methyl-D-erythritol 4-phosphate cytidylyltransferase/2-C-methyl-D-erythritol 2,4-cyclodiphosphate synthase
MTVIAVLAAAGRGERLGGSGPKALVPLAGRPLLELALAGLEAAPIDGVIVARPPGDERVAEVAARFRTVVDVVDGGATRQASMRNALAALPECDIVVCHDAARPFASPELFTAVLAALDAADGAVPVLPVHDTVKRMAGEVVVETMPRHELGLAQTPQAFRREVLETAHRLAEEGVGASDDAALVERARYKVVAVPGEPGNLKITTPEDVLVASERARD